MPDPARLTDMSCNNPEHDGLEARLAAAENGLVVSVYVNGENRHSFPYSLARSVQWWEPCEGSHTYIVVQVEQKEPTGNHAESSATRGDTNE